MLESDTSEMVEATKRGFGISRMYVKVWRTGVLDIDGEQLAAQLIQSKTSSGTLMAVLRVQYYYVLFAIVSEGKLEI